MAVQEDVVLLTLTKYSGIHRNRQGLGRRTIREARQAGYEIIVVDSGSDANFVDYARALDAEICTNNGTIGECYRQAIRIALDTQKPYIIGLEAEKFDFLKSIPICLDALVKTDSDISIPQRKSTASYPKAQRYLEKFVRVFFRELTGIDIDIFFGPKIWKRDMSDYFLDYNPDYGDIWHNLVVPVVDMIHGKKRITTPIVDFTYPQQQRAQEEHDIQFYLKRLEQAQMINAFYKRWCDLNTPTIN